MAITLDINILCKEQIVFSVLRKGLEEQGIKIHSVTCIDNWIWENQQLITDTDGLERTLNAGKIIVVELQTLGIKDMGLFAEKCDQWYIYNFWLNTEGYDELDCDEITPENEQVYNHIYDMLQKLHCNNSIRFEAIGIGVEMMLHSSHDLSEILKKSCRVVSWILPDDLHVDRELVGYSKRCKNNLNFFERRENKMIHR